MTIVTFHLPSTPDPQKLQWLMREMGVTEVYVEEEDAASDQNPSEPPQRRGWWVYLESPTAS